MNIDHYSCILQDLTKIYFVYNLIFFQKFKMHKKLPPLETCHMSLYQTTPNYSIYHEFFPLTISSFLLCHQNQKALTSVGIFPLFVVAWVAKE